LAVVQNGIIENYRGLREELQAEGVVFLSETDTEVIPHLLARELERRRAAGEQASAALLLGCFAVGVAVAAGGLRPGGGVGRSPWSSGGGP
jgi:Glucosamine 6-phosphate synthetase, contains amidotransferase and phosphosugar isomerase domains